MRAPQTRVGDIFEIPITPQTKRYMQFILVDSSCLGGWCIRVFKKEYAIEDKPDMEDVISDKVDFYCLTYAIGHGVLDELWTKAGKSKELGSFDNIVFKQKDIIHGGWRIWRARQEVKHYKTLPKKYVKASKGASFFERLAGAEFIPKELKII